jgi:hypothetical protein
LGESYAPGSYSNSAAFLQREARVESASFEIPFAEHVPVGSSLSGVETGIVESLAFETELEHQ